MFQVWGWTPQGRLQRIWRLFDEMPVADAPTYIVECVLDVGIVAVHGGMQVQEREETDPIMEPARLARDSNKAPTVCTRERKQVQ